MLSLKQVQDVCINSTDLTSCKYFMSVTQDDNGSLKFVNVCTKFAPSEYKKLKK